jgi:hypothetical protein
MIELFNHYLEMRKGVKLTIYDNISMPSWHYLFVLSSMALISKGVAKNIYHIYGYFILLSVILLGCHYLADMIVSVLLFLVVKSIYDKSLYAKNSLLYLHNKLQISQKITRNNHQLINIKKLKRGSK